MSQLVQKRNKHIDNIRGILIVLVMLGHILPGTINQNWARFFIYSFHMPIFFMLSGYLININGCVSFKSFTSKYIIRIVVPWGIAILVYYLLNTFVNGNQFSVKKLIRAYQYPWYHLWYVYGFMFCVIIYICSYLIHSKIEQGNLLFILGLMCLVTYELGIAEKFFPNFTLYVKPQYLFYFAIGILFKKKIFVVKNSLGFTIILGFLVMCMFKNQDNLCTSILKCMFSVVLFETVIFSKSIKQIKLTCFIGEHSFNFYLWHVIGKIIANWIRDGKYDCLYYAINFMWIVLLYIIIYEYEMIRCEREK